MSKNKNLKSLKTLDGQLKPSADQEDKKTPAAVKNAPKAKIMTLNQLLGDTGLSKYGTLDMQVFEDNLDKMNYDELQDYAIDKGVKPTTFGDAGQAKNRIKRALLEDFRVYTSSFNVTAAEQPKNVKKGADLLKQVQDIMRDGR